MEAHHNPAMAHVFEPAASGRSKCRGCGRALARGELRFGERLPNPFAEGTEITLWFHPACAAYKRPAAMLEALAQAAGEIPDREALERVAREGTSHERLARLDGAERARAQATCRQCREPIVRGAWRLRLAFFGENARFEPGGFVHVACGAAYFGDADLLERTLHFTAELAPADRDELCGMLRAPGQLRENA
jgi:hypothetical protein